MPSTPDPSPEMMQAIERLGYRVTVGDVAAQAGLNLNLAEQGLLTLASQAGGHLQVAESGDLVYLFPQDFRSILRNKFWRLRLQEWWNRVWKILFYLIRVSFGVLLLASILLIAIAIVVIITAINSSQDGDSDQDSDGGLFRPSFWFSPDWFWIFYPNYYDSPAQSQLQQQRSPADDAAPMNFLESVFSFLFGDGDPNRDLEERRWQTIGRVIRNQRGAVVAEQIAPYLDELGQGYAQEYEEYMLPVLTRFNGRPEVSPEGAIVYHFPELQTTAAQTTAAQIQAAQTQPKPVAAYLKEKLWQFSRASSGQLILAAVLGGVNLAGALALGKLLAGGAAQIGGLVAFVQSIYWLLLGYGAAFLLIPLGRYFWIQWRNRKLVSRNQSRQDRAAALNQAGAAIQKKLAYAQQFAAETVISEGDLVYSTDRDLVEQEVERSQAIDAEWEQRLNQRRE
jgi:hypothetical protein